MGLDFESLNDGIIECISAYDELIKKLSDKGINSEQVEEMLPFRTYCTMAILNESIDLTTDAIKDVLVK